MSFNPLVSILIPAFNAQNWIADTIKSAINQTWERKEIVVVDDGSTDQTLDVLRSFNSSIIKIIRQENSGACRARNRAFSECQGEYIQWLDADDLLAPDKIEQQLKALGPVPDPGILCTSAWEKFHHKSQDAQYHPTRLWKDHDPIEWLCLWLSNPWSQWMMPPVVWLVSRPLTERAGPWDERLILNQDGEYFCRVVSLSRRIKFVPEAHCFYRIDNPTSISKSTSRMAWESLALSIDLITQHVLARENSKRTREACIKIMNVTMTTLEYHASDLADFFRQRVIQLGGVPLYIFNSKKYALLSKIIGNRNTQVFRTAMRKSRYCISYNCSHWLAKLFGSDS